MKTIGWWQEAGGGRCVAYRGPLDDRFEKAAPNAAARPAKPYAAQGYDVVLPISRGFVMPAGAPKEVTDSLAAAFKKALTSEDFKKKAVEIGLEPNYLDPEQYSALWVAIEKQIEPVMAEIKAAQPTK